jgi:methyl-accepting chemotaxis protein
MRRIVRNSLTTKLVSLVLMALVGSIAIGGASLWLLKSAMTTDREAEARTAVELIDGAITRMEGLVRDGKMTDADARREIGGVIHAMRYDGSNYLYVMGEDGTIVIHGADPAREGKNAVNDSASGLYKFTNDALAAIRNRDTGVFFSSGVVPATGKTTSKLYYLKRFAPWHLIIGTSVTLDDIDQRFQDQAGILLLCAGIILAVTLVPSWLVARSLARPLSHLAAVMQRLAQGDTAVTVTGTTRADQIGDMARSIDVFRQNALEKAQMEDERTATSARHAAERRQAMFTLADAFEQEVGTVAERLAVGATDVRHGAETVSGTVDRLRAQASSVSAAAEQASSNVQTVAGATEELSASIGEVNQQVASSTAIAQRATDIAAGAETTVGLLADGAQKIGAVVSVINDVAARTNLLALNATIEAARAGDAGKGFAVVATEVKQLAGQTARATEEIRQQIEAMQRSTGDTVEAIAAISNVIRQMNEISASIAAAIEQQRAATAEIARNVHEAARGTQGVTANIGEVSSSAELSGQASATALGVARELSQQSAVLREAVTAFLGKVRTI